MSSSCVKEIIKYLKRTRRPNSVVNQPCRTTVWGCNYFTVGKKILSIYFDLLAQHGVRQASAGLFIRRKKMAKKRKSLEFQCYKCGGNKLAYRKYVEYIAPVEIRSNGGVYYEPLMVDTSEYSNTYSIFCCRDCGAKLVYNNRHVRTPKQLQTYLENTLDRYIHSYSEEEKQAMFDLMDRVEKDGVKITKLEKDM